MFPCEYHEALQYDVQHGALLATATYWPAPGTDAAAPHGRLRLADADAAQPVACEAALHQLRAQVWAAVWADEQERWGEGF